MNKRKQVTVVIAEDEPIILNNIAKKVSNTAEYIQVVGKTENGLKTLDFLANHAIPDILITDIEMPGMNGLELIQQVTASYPSIHIVILSGYDNFEYARTALRYGVEEYLLKPISQSDLSAILLKLAEQILEEKLHTERNILSKTLSDLQDDVIPSTYFEGKSFVLSLITLGNLPSKYVPASYVSNPEQIWNQIDFKDCLSANANTSHFWIIDEAYRMQKFVIIHMDSEVVNIDYLNISLYRCLSDVLKGTPFHIVTSNETIPYTDIWRTAKQLRQYTKEVVTMCSQTYHLLSPKPETFAWGSKRQQESIDFLAQIDTIKQLTKYMEDTLKSYIQNQLSQHYIDHFIYECYRLLPLMFSLDEHACQLAMNAFLSSLHAYSTADELCDRVNASLKELYLNYSTETSTDFLYEKIKQYIDNNYNQKITAEDLSRRYGYTTSYINRMFKKECGTSPLQYMTTLRIEHAKELLRQHVDIKKIATTVGYEDARYFSRVFKQETGMTPSAWVESVQ